MKRSLAAWAAAVAATLTGVWSAGAAPTSVWAPAERLQLLHGRHDVFNVASPHTTDALAGHSAVVLQYVDRPIRVGPAVGTGSFPLVRALGVLELAGGLSLSHGLEATLVVPLWLRHLAAAPWLASDLGRPHTRADLGDLRLTPKWGIWQGQRLAVGVAVPLGILASKGAAFVSNGPFTANPRALAAWTLPAQLQLALNFGYLARPNRLVLGSHVGGSLTWGASLAWRLPKVLHAWSVQLAAYGDGPLTRSRRAAALVEGLLGVRGEFAHGWSAVLAGGVGLTHALGAPNGRVLWQVAYALPEAPGPVAPERVPSAAGPAPAAPAAGQLAGAQEPAAPTEPAGGPAASPGKAPAAPSPSSEPLELELVPITPTAPTAPTAPNAPRQAGRAEALELPLLAPPPSGRPGHAVADIDAVPPGEEAGDRDGDGIRNGDDRCPDVAGALGGPQSGCPATQAAAGEVLTSLVVPYHMREGLIVFGQDAEVALRAAAQLLRAYGKLKVVIEGHVPSVPGMAEATATRLSLSRATTVLEWLVAHDIGRERLATQARGASDLVDAGAGPQAAERNRRVTLRLPSSPETHGEASGGP